MEIHCSLNFGFKKSLEVDWLKAYMVGRSVNNTKYIMDTNAKL